MGLRYVEIPIDDFECSEAEKDLFKGYIDDDYVDDNQPELTPEMFYESIREEL